MPPESPSSKSRRLHPARTPPPPNPNHPRPSPSPRRIRVQGPPCLPRACSVGAGDGLRERSLRVTRTPPLPSRFKQNQDYRMLYLCTFLSDAAHEKTRRTWPAKRSETRQGCETSMRRFATRPSTPPSGRGASRTFSPVRRGCARLARVPIFAALPHPPDVAPRTPTRSEARLRQLMSLSENASHARSATPRLPRRPRRAWEDLRRENTHRRKR